DADRVPVPGPLWVFYVDVGGGLGSDAVAGGVFEVALEAAFAGLVVGGDDLGGDERLLHLVQGEAGVVGELLHELGRDVGVAGEGHAGEGGEEVDGERVAVHRILQALPCHSMPLVQG